jgi:hypothetical protein
LQPDVEGGNELEQGRGLKPALAGIGLFSAKVLGMALYDYQLAPLEAALESLRGRHGRDFLLVFPRQSDKNEAVAHLLVYLLNVLRRDPGQIVYAAIGDGVGRGLRRLEARLDNELDRGKWRRGGQPLRRSLGRASVVFISSHPSAFSRGETAHWLLVVDELQDQDAAHLEAVFEPMRAANNATALYLGTVRSRHDALWQKKEALERLEAADGVRRVFMVTPEMVTAANPRYGAFLAEKERRLGRLHPIVQSEYYLRPLDGEAGLFPPRRQALMQGSHPRQQGPRPGQLNVATLDLAGQDEAATDPVARLASPGRDYTVCTIFEVQLAAGNPPIPDPRSPTPVFLALDVFVDHGSRHFQDAPGRPALVRRLLAYLQQWQVSQVIADATGVGEGVVDWLAAALGPQRVTPFKFTAASKAQLGSRFLTLVETGRFHYWSDPQSLIPDPLSDAWWFWQQVAACTYDLPPGGAFERQLRWGVPAGATAATPLGRQPLHDDRLLSAALVAHADALIAAGTLRLGSGQSVVIGPAEPEEGW